MCWIEADFGIQLVVHAQVSEAEEQEREKLDVIRQQEAALAAAKTKAALAKWRRLQVKCLCSACASFYLMPATMWHHSVSLSHRCTNIDKLSSLFKQQSFVLRLHPTSRHS